MIRRVLTSRARHRIQRQAARAAALLDGATLTLLDVGAAESAPPRWQPYGSVIDYVAVEPDPRSSGAVTNSPVSAFNSRRVITKGLWSSEGIVDLHLCRKPLTSSIYAPNTELLARFPDASRFDVVGKERMAVTTVDKIASEHDLYIDAIKLDVQGAELEVLRGAQQSLRQVLLVEAEVEFQPMYVNQPLAAEVSDHLARAGFEFLDYLSLYRWHPQTLDGTGQLVFADALYVRTPETLSATDLMTHRKLAALSVIYGRGDLLHRISSITTDSVLADKLRVLGEIVSQQNSASLSVLAKAARLARLSDGNVRSHVFH
jgi:FkbM family methyltransferase